jgi:benzoyl-CoA reductase/2-hydroxyglutaryl-CoA dehydratase subunit BcrC/BadD/HgdB
MRKLMPTGLFDRVSARFALLSRIPPPLLNSMNSIMTALRLMPEDVAPSAKAMMVPRVREVSVALLKMISRWIVEARRASREGKKVILVPFNFPVELIHAFDKAVPLTSEVLTTLGVVMLQGQGEQYWDIAMGLGLPDHLCSANAIELGSILSNEDFQPEAMVSSAPGGCDANSKIHEFVANYLEIPHFFLQKPPEDTGRGRSQYSVYTRNLVSELEEFLDEKLTEDKLRVVMEKANRCSELYFELWDLKKAVPCPVPNLFSLSIYGTRFTMWGRDEGVKTMETMVRVAKDRLAKKAYPAEKEVARCLWVYTSYYYDFMGFFNWMEEQGYSHLGDGLDLYFPQVIDTSSMDSMLEGIAEAGWNMPMTRQVGAESMFRAWTEDVIWSAKELNADCAIYCGHHSCKQTWSVVSILREELMNRLGLPLLILQGDAWIKRMTPMSVLQQEIDEFIKNVVVSKSTRRRKPKKRKRTEMESATGNR